MLPDPTQAIGLLKPSVRALRAYLLDAPSTPRKLNQNEAPADFPEDLRREVLARAARVSWHRYPAFVPSGLCARIAERHDWVPEGVLVGNGSNEVIQAALNVVIGPGDVVVAPEPTFSLYRLLTGVAGGRFVAVPLGPDFRFDVDAIRRTAIAESARAVVVNSPNNPTGSALPEGGAERLLGDTGGLLLCDEAYQEFGGPSAIGLLRQSARLVVFRTLSKAFGLAGLRFGYALAHPDMVREIAKAKLPYNVNAITLAAAEVALENVGRLAERTREIVAERERFLTRLAGLPGLKAYPSEANFVLIRFEALPASTVFERLVRDFGILVRDVSHGPQLGGCLRISIGTPDDMDAVMAGLRQLLVGDP
jgi:histidinol-phosphate aminotransferase